MVLTWTGMASPWTNTMLSSVVILIYAAMRRIVLTAPAIATTALMPSWVIIRLNHAHLPPQEQPLFLPLLMLTTTGRSLRLPGRILSVRNLHQLILKYFYRTM